MHNENKKKDRKKVYLLNSRDNALTADAEGVWRLLEDDDICDVIVTVLKW